MILDGFNLIESSKTGALTFRKENHTIFFSPHLLPKESHGYAAKENILHMLWEQDQWLEKYVKNKGKNSEKK